MFTISDTLLRAISWTLVHTIWQGFILAFLAGIVILTTKKATSALRYNLLSGLFLAFIVFVGLTFNYEYGNENEESVKSLNFSIEHIKSVWTVENGTVSNNLSTLVIDFLNTNANTIVLIWFIIFCFKCFNITSNLSHIYKIRNYRNQPVSDYWKERLEALSQAIQLNKRIVLLESQLVKVPSVTGFFKPIILLPIGLLSQLPQDQVEAILLHELAHIRRKDYFVNLLQSFAEIVFFFNPGVLWLSSLIKEERENCCDDIAVSVTKCKAKFVHALVSFQEYNMKNNELIMGFGGKKDHLLNRAKRIINNDVKSLNAVEKTFLSIAVFSVVFVMIACSNATLSDTKMPPLEPLAEIASKEDKTKSNSEYCDKIAPEVGPITEAQAKVQEAMLKEQTNLKKPNESPAGIDSDKGKEAFQEDEAIKQEAEATKQKAEAVKQKAEATKQKAEATKQEAKSASDAKGKKEFTTYKSTAVTTNDNKVQITEKITINTDKVLDAPEQVSEDIIKDLKINRIISGKANLSYSLSQDKLVVNGVVQPDSVHLKFKKKYLIKIHQTHTISNNISIVYNYDISNLVACN